MTAFIYSNDLLARAAAADDGSCCTRDEGGDAAGAGANAGGGELLREAGNAPPRWRIEYAFDESERLVGVKRYVLEGGQWRALRPDEPAPRPEECEHPGGRWTIAWGDDGPASDGAPAGQPATAGPPIPCPACKGAGTIPLLTTRRPCDHCGGTGKAAS